MFCSKRSKRSSTLEMKVSTLAVSRATRSLLGEEDGGSSDFLVDWEETDSGGSSPFWANAALRRISFSRDVSE